LKAEDRFALTWAVAWLTCVASAVMLMVSAMTDTPVAKCIALCYAYVMTRKPQANFRLTREAKRLLQKLADIRGISQTATLEILIREKAKREKIE
jgi:hypothetical protein